MATAKKRSPNRRKSIAVPPQPRPSLVPKNRRRAHSIVPGASLSPFSKVRRSLAPRKSILKSSVVSNVDPTSQQSVDEHTSIRSMDITQDLSAHMDNTTRKSFGRRVSFASQTYIRMFDSKRSNSTGSPHSSPTSPGQPVSRQNVTDENAYPGSRRRSSIFAGSDDMEMTTVMTLGDNPLIGSAILEEELDSESDNMEITQAVNGRFASSSRLSLSSDNEYQSEDANDTSQSMISEDQSQIMEFTVPLGQSLRPAAQDPAWLALKQMTHSGIEAPEAESNSDDSFEHNAEVGMNLEDAMERLRRARESMSSQASQMDDNTFTSTEESFEGDIEEGDKTLNLTQVLGRFSLGTDARMSVGYPDSNMDESEVYGNIVQQSPAELSTLSQRPSSIPRDVDQSPAQEVISPVFQLPSNTTAAAPATSGLSVFTKPVSPSKNKQDPNTSAKLPRFKPTFSAAFAPPVSKPSPKRPVDSVARIPAKRRFSTNDEDTDSKPSPAKKLALADKWMGVTASRTEIRISPQRQKSDGKPKQLSPSKKALFQKPSGVVQSSVNALPVGTKKNSGYFARRKSVAAGFDHAANHPNAVSLTSPKKGAESRRLSVGSVPSARHSPDDDLWKRSAIPSPDVFSNIKANESIQKPSSLVVVPVAMESPPSTLQELVSASQPQIVNDSQEHTIPTFEVTPPIEESLNADSQSIRIDVEATQQWREAVQPVDYNDEEELPAISISQFFQMTGIKYMDELAAPRRSLHPGLQPIPQSRNVVDIPLAEYVTAMAIDIPQLDLYSRVSNDLEGWIQKSKIVFAQAEEEAAKVTPELFVEYARADEVGREELGHQLTLIRTHTRYLARSDWYDWKLQWVEGLCHTASEAFKSLEDDARALEKLIKANHTLVPDLEKEYEQLMQELEQEQSEVKEIESCDQDYLNELKASIAEQSIEIEALKAEASEAMDQSNWVQDKLQEVETQMNEAQATIRNAERVLQLKRTSTRSEVFRLKAELEALEGLNMMSVIKVSANHFEYLYGSTFVVSIPCVKFRPIVRQVRIIRNRESQTRYKDDFPKLSTFFLATANHLINEGDDLNVREIVHRLADYWSACSQLRSQLLLVKVKYPVEIIVSAPQPERQPYFRAKTQILFPSARAKAFVYFTFSFDTVTQWPLSLGSLNCEVEVAYGAVDRSAILEAVVNRLSQVTPAENYACLLDACIEAQDINH